MNPTTSLLPGLASLGAGLFGFRATVNIRLRAPIPHISAGGPTAAPLLGFFVNFHIVASSLEGVCRLLESQLYERQSWENVGGRDNVVLGEVEIEPLHADDFLAHRRLLDSEVRGCQSFTFTL